MITKTDSVLIIGNPPWVTNSQLSSIQSYNLPMKSNFKQYSGYDAITGKGNFDIAESIIIKMLTQFSKLNCVLAMLCKTIVAKNIIRDMKKYNFKIVSADLFVFNAKDVFNVSCDAALFVVQLGKNSTSVCNVYDYYTTNKIRKFGWENDLFLYNISDSPNIAEIDGSCQFAWRQGVKHDCSKIMELRKTSDGMFQNLLGEIMNFSLGEYVFPLLKSSDIKSTEICETRRFVIVTQKRINDDTKVIESIDPALWSYLMSHSNLLNARKSIIYKKAPLFAMFGIGSYSFSIFKVGISGFYKEPLFALITGEIPIMLDDTCYFLSFNKLSDAVITTALLNSPACILFLKSVAFLDSKRPYTKEVLRRIDLLKLSELIGYSFVCDFAKKMKGKYVITEQQFAEYQLSLNTFEQLTTIKNSGIYPKLF
jgi:hypothetical protein